jgi:hypothetical protein
LAAVALMTAGAGVERVNARQVTAPECGINLKLLVISADGTEAELPAIRQTLDYLGTPYDLFVASTEPPLTAARLTNGCTGFYQGVIATTGNIVDPWYTILASDEKAALDAYESLYGVRRIVWYAYPTPTLGFNAPDGVDWSGAAVSTAFTSAGAAVFTHVNRTNPLIIRNAGVIFATPLDSATVPLLVDGGGHSLAAVRQYPDGRETLTLTFDSNPYLTHILVLGYDLVNWVTKGIFLGERHAYISPQADDLFLTTDIWTPATACGTVGVTGSTYRLSGADYTAAVNWQRKVRIGALTKNVRLTMAYNGEGADGAVRPDTLTPKVRKYTDDFLFVSHTWSHPMLDVPFTFSDTVDEVLFNDWMALKLRLPVDFRNLVTPNLSGLRNPEALRAMVEMGVRYVVTDTSQPGYMNPTPNTGLWNEYQPKLFMIPRYPTNLFYNVSTPAEWLAEYNCMYRAYWGHDFTYAELVNNISDTMVTYLLKGDLNPLMFLLANLRAYDGVHSLLGDVIDNTMAKYSSLVTFPIASPAMNEVGDKMIARQTYNQAGVSATLVPGKELVIKAVNAAVVPLTGVNVAGAEQYAGQPIAYITMAAGSSKTLGISVPAR